MNTTTTTAVYIGRGTEVHAAHAQTRIPLCGTQFRRSGVSPARGAVTCTKCQAVLAKA